MFKFITIAVLAMAAVNGQGQGDFHSSASKQFGGADRNMVFSGYGTQPKNGPPTLGGAATLNANNHAASLGGSHTLGSGSQLTGAGSLNLANSGPHRVDANAFHTHNFPNRGQNFGTTGGGLGYSHSSGHGLSGSVAHTPQFRHTEATVQGNVNLFKDQHSSLDANLGRSQSFSPYGNSRPNTFGGLTYQRRF